LGLRQDAKPVPKEAEVIDLSDVDTLEAPVLDCFSLQSEATNYYARLRGGFSSGAAELRLLKKRLIGDCLKEAD